MSKELSSVPPTVTARLGAQRLNAHLEAGNRIKGTVPFSDQNYSTWRTFTSEDLRACFGTDSSLVDKFIDLGPFYYPKPLPPRRSSIAIMSGIDRHIDPPYQHFPDRTEQIALPEQLQFLQACLQQLERQVAEEAQTSLPSQPAEISVADLRESLGFLSDGVLRDIVERDLAELETAISNGLNKTTLLLCGSVLEASLIDVLDRRRDIASTFLKRKKFPDEASLDDLLSIAGTENLPGDGLRILTETAISLGIAVKDHRDLIHPHREVRSGIKVDSDTAKSMIHLLRLVVRDLRIAHEKGVLKLYEDK